MSRPPLAENSVNQPAVRSPHKTRRPQTRPLEGRDLKEWQREWRKIMYSSVFYFDCVDAPAVDKVRPVLDELNCRVTAFFENTVTIVVTKRGVPAASASDKSGDVLVKAQNAGMKVWTYEKLLRFLTNLYGRSPFTRADKTDHTQLSALLQEEKLIGPTDRDPTAKRDDYHYFKAEYLLVWDVGHKYKPTIIKDYYFRNESEATWWPQLRITSAGRSPFVCDVPTYYRRNIEPVNSAAASNSNEKRVVDPSTARIRQPMFPEEESGLKRKWTENQPKPAEPINNKRLVTDDHYKQVHQQQSSNTSTATLHAVYDVAASGIQKSASTSATRSVIQSGEPGQQLPQFASREIANLKRKVLGRPAPITSTANPVTTTNPPTANTTATGTTTPRADEEDSQRLHQVHTSGVPVRANVTNASNPTTATTAVVTGATGNTGTAGNAVVAPLKKDKKSDKMTGYCENCNERYEKFADHVVSKRHLQFANDEDNFADLDKLINSLSCQTLHV
ncbi:hypothetical protein TRVA0_016S01002 [Trichomonascus vanleenenianus]|uniref:protein serine/threonine kinase activating protein DBF4 n=1 Tax=Trichomonascus vanleenenianus TaxID=2268995 RepID=UPI003ECB80EF